MPHLLIAGATGSGKSVCVNSIITALLLTHTPETLRFLMIDPKRVELTVYNGIPHLIAPVVVEVERAVPVLQWATREMERRYKLFAKISARNIESYNEKLAARGEQILPYIVILIDELADLMLSAPDDVERYVCRIAQMARATGIHLVIATQRPSVDVVTGLIKANFPARIAFAVTSQIDSRVILDTPGAEQLLGRGDMLFMAPDTSKLQRLQGCFVSDRETSRLVALLAGRSLPGGRSRAGRHGRRRSFRRRPSSAGDGTETWEAGAVGLCSDRLRRAAVAARPGDAAAAALERAWPAPDHRLPAGMSSTTRRWRKCARPAGPASRCCSAGCASATRAPRASSRSWRPTAWSAPTWAAAAAARCCRARASPTASAARGSRDDRTKLR